MQYDDFISDFSKEICERRTHALNKAKERYEQDVANIKSIYDEIEMNANYFHDYLYSIYCEAIPCEIKTEYGIEHSIIQYTYEKILISDEAKCFKACPVLGLNTFEDWYNLINDEDDNKIDKEVLWSMLEHATVPGVSAYKYNGRVATFIY